MQIQESERGRDGSWPSPPSRPAQLTTFHGSPVNSPIGVADWLQRVLAGDAPLDKSSQSRFRDLVHWFRAGVSGTERVSWPQDEPRPEWYLTLIESMRDVRFTSQLNETQLAAAQLLSSEEGVNSTHRASRMRHSSSIPEEERPVLSREIFAACVWFYLSAEVRQDLLEDTKTLSQE